MVSTTIILLESLCIVTISHLDKRPPEWLRQIASGCLARLFCLKQEIPDIADSTIEQKSKTGIRCQSQVVVNIFCHLITSILWYICDDYHRWHYCILYIYILYFILYCIILFYILYLTNYAVYTLYIQINNSHICL